MKLLLLAGTSDARRIAFDLHGSAIKTVASFAGKTRQPLDLPCEIRVSGFGGRDGFRAYLQQAGIGAVVDATHPFAAIMSATAAVVCTDLGCAHIQMLRPAWVAQPGDQWVNVARESEVAAHISGKATVFLATGRKTLHAFENLSDHRLYCRQLTPPDGRFPFPNGEFLLGRAPFSVADETALFQKLGVDWLVVKNAGGQASRSKLEAARALGIKVAMIARPPQPECARVSSTNAALDWIRHRSVLA